jgi:ornithine decarboxylase
MMAHYQNSLAAVEALKPSMPLTCLRPHEWTRMARLFVSQFPGLVLYAVKCNPDPVILQALRQGGIEHFDTASLNEINAVRSIQPDAGCYFMHPVKSREAIKAAYFQKAVRHFVVDCRDELEKIAATLAAESLAPPRDVVIMVRLATARGAAVYDLGGKFGCTVEQGAALMQAATAKGWAVGLCFHVGSQCMTPNSYVAAMRLAGECARQAGIEPAIIDVGGGFPTRYVGATPPPLENFFDAIKQSLTLVPGPADRPLWCEPGRGIAASGASVVVRVELRRDRMLYINDGIYGNLVDLRYPGIHMPMRGIRMRGGRASFMTGALQPFGLFGPTCDCVDQLPGPYALPDDINEGDWIEIGQAGAYTGVTATDFNGFRSDARVIVEDEPFIPLS